MLERIQKPRIIEQRAHALGLRPILNCPSTLHEFPGIIESERITPIDSPAEMTYRNIITGEINIPILPDLIIAPIPWGIKSGE